MKTKQIRLLCFLFYLALYNIAQAQDTIITDFSTWADAGVLKVGNFTVSPFQASQTKGSIAVTVKNVSVNDAAGCQSVVIDGTTNQLVLEASGTSACNNSIAFVQLTFSRVVSKVVIRGNLENTAGAIVNTVPMAMTTGTGTTTAITWDALNQDFVNISLNAIYDAATNTTQQIRFTITSIEVDYGENTFEYLDSTLEPIVAVAQPIPLPFDINTVTPINFKYGDPATDFSLLIPIEDLDNGEFPITTDPNAFFEILGTQIAGDDGTNEPNPFGKSKLYLEVLMRWLGPTNGPRVATLELFSNQANIKTKQVTFTIEGATAPGFVWQGMAGWFKADSGVAAVNNGQSIASWNETSAYGLTLVQTSSVSQPSYVIDDGSAINGVEGINFNPTIKFTSPQSFRYDVTPTGGVLPPEDPWPASETTNLSTFIVYKPSSATPGALFGLSSGTTSNRGLYSLVGRENTIGGANNVELSNITGLFVKDKVTLASLIYNEGVNNGSSLRLQSESLVSFTSNTLSAVSEGFTLGGRGNDSDTFDGEIAEIVVYNRSLSVSAINQIESYFTMKYGLERKEGLINSDGSILYDDQTYYRNLMVLGSNSEMALEQSSTKSETEGAFASLSSPAPLGDNEFFIVGNDGLPVDVTSENILSGYVRTERTWKVASSSAINDLEISFDLNALAVLYDKSIVNNYALFISPTEDFTNVSFTPIQPTFVDGSRVSFTLPSSIPDGSFFTLGAQVNAISGTLYSDAEKTTPIGGKKITGVFDAIDGSGNPIKQTRTTITTASGTYLFLTSNLGSTADPKPNGGSGMVTNFIVYVDDEVEKAVTYAKLDNVRGYSEIDLIQNYFSLFGIDLPTTIENENIKIGLESVNDSDVADFVDVKDATFEMTTKNGMSLYIEGKTKYKPAANITIDGSIVFAGRLIGARDPTIKFTKDWKPTINPNDASDPIGKFIRENTTVELTGDTQIIFGDNSFYRFTKIGKANDMLYFERGKTTRIEEVAIIEGKSQSVPLGIRSVDEKGFETPGELAFMDNYIDESTIDNRSFKYLSVRDNRNLDDDLIDPQQSNDLGNNFDWFTPTVQWVVDPTDPFKTEEIVTEGDFDHTVTIKLSSRSSKPTAVTIGISSKSTAVNPSDFGNLSTRLFRWLPKPQTLEQTLTIPIRDDPPPGVFEGTEQIVLEILDIGLVNVKKLPEFEYTLNIVDNDAAPLVSITTYPTMIYENDGGVNNPTSTKIVAEVKEDISVPIEVELETTGTAIKDQDYYLSSEKIIIRPGSLCLDASGAPRPNTTCGEVSLFATDDPLFEIDETVTLNIVNVVNGAEDGVQTADVIIRSADLEPNITLNTDIVEVQETGGTARFFAILDGPSQVDVTVDLLPVQTVTNPAIDRVDFDLFDANGVASRSFLIKAGERTSNFLVFKPTTDYEAEFDETVDITFNNLVGANDPAPAELITMTIIDDDADASQSQIAADPDRILGDGNSVSEISVKLFSKDGLPLTNSGGKVVVETNAGTLLPLNRNTASTVTDFGNGSYSSTLESEAAGNNDIIATVSATVNGNPISNVALVIFTNQKDSDGDLIPDECECPGAMDCPDSDGDGTPNFLDLDSDEDNLPDIIECNAPSTNSCACLDTDLDDIPDFLESNIGDIDRDDLFDNMDFDSDNDGKSDSDECGIYRECGDSDGDMISENLDGDDAAADPEGGDTDMDGIKDATECPQLPCIDSDQDGSPDYFDSDSNNNGISDAVECPNGACPDCDGDGLDAIADNDDDNNGIPDVREAGINNPLLDIDGDGINAYCDPDDDGDGLLDKDECPNGPICPDTDGDGLKDIIDLDSDNDGASDNNECLGTSPCPDFDGDGIPNNLDQDADGDTIPDQLECQGQVGGICPDDDGDGAANNLDLDTNGNGILDQIEGIGDCDLDSILAFRDNEQICNDILAKVGVFTPNGDGLNDFWYIENIGLFKDNSVKVFSRNGSLIFEVNGYDNSDPEKRWDGRVFGNSLKLTKRETMPVGTYFFTIDPGKEGIDIVSGFVMLTK